MKIGDLVKFKDITGDFPGIQGDLAMVVEADEFDRSFLTLSPDVAIITSVDADHLDIYGSSDEMLKSFKAFSERVTENGTLIYRFGLPFEDSSRRNFTYSVSEESDYYT